MTCKLMIQLVVFLVIALNHVTAYSLSYHFEWFFYTNSGVASIPSMDEDNNIYVVSGQKLYSVTSEGAFRWYFEFTSDPPKAYPSIGSDGTIYCGSQELTALTRNGDVKWSYSTIPYTISTPAVSASGSVYFASYRTLYAVDNSGELQWSLDITDGGGYAIRSLSSPVIATDGTIYVGSYDQKLVAVSPEGNIIWEFTEPRGAISSTPAIGLDGTIYVGSLNRLYAVDAAGNKKWDFAVTGDVTTSPVIGTDEMIYVASDEGSLYAIGNHGLLKWKIPFQVSNEYAPSLAVGQDGIIYAASKDGNMYAYYPDGSFAWKFNVGSSVFSPVVSDTGMLVFGASDLKLYAIQTDSIGTNYNAWPMFMHSPAKTGLTPVPNKYPVAVTSLKNFYIDNLILDGSQSYDQDGTITKYLWEIEKYDGDYWVMHEGQKVSIGDLPAGFYKVKLKVYDDKGGKGLTSKMIGFVDTPLGDITQNGYVGLEDAITILEVLSGSP